MAVGWPDSSLYVRRVCLLRMKPAALDVLHVVYLFVLVVYLAARKRAPLVSGIPGDMVGEELKL